MASIAPGRWLVMPITKWTVSEWCGGPSNPKSHFDNPGLTGSLPVAPDA
jgi:hypothetical protein